MKSFLAVLACAAVLAAAFADRPLHAPVHDDVMIAQINAASPGWTAGFNDRFAGATLADAKRLCGAIRDTREADIAKSFLNEYDGPVYADIPSEFDVAKQWPQCADTINLVLDQADCGSCWAMSSTHSFTDRLCIATNAKFTAQLSAQDTTSCCSLGAGAFECFSNQGCNGGIPASAWSWFSSKGVVTGGLYEGDGCYPYSLAPCSHHVKGQYPPCQGEGPTPSCAASSCTNGNYSTPWASDVHHAGKSYSLGSVQEIQSALMSGGSVTAAFSVYEDFLTYTSGVYKHTTGQYLGGHAIKIQGWGEENGTPYWRVQNSWNPTWGDGGYFKILRGSNECGIEADVVAGDAQ